MSQFTFFADVLTALGGAIEKDKKKTKPEGTKIPFRSGLSETNGQVPPLLEIPKSDIQQDIELGIVDRNINMPVGKMLVDKPTSLDPRVTLPSYDVKTEEQEARELQQTKDNLAAFGLTGEEEPRVIPNTVEEVVTQTVTADPIDDKIASLENKPDPSFIEKALASAGLPNTDYLKQKAGEELTKFGNSFSSPEAFGRQLAHSLSVPGELAIEAVKKGTDLTAAGIETVGDPLVRFGQGFAGTEVTGIEPGSLGRYYPEESKEVPKTNLESQSPIPVVKEEVTKKETTTEKVSSEEDQVVTNNNIISDPSNQEAKVLIDNAVDETLITEDFPRLMPGEGSSQQTIEETFNQEVLDNKGNTVKDPKKSFLSQLWDGVKDVVVTQFKDPANQRALFAYAVSRALGYDGVTLASQVLANEWEQKAATLKHERELERIYGKEQIAAMKKQREDETIDYSKPVTVYDPKKNENLTIYLSKNKQKFRFGDGGTVNYSLGALLKKGFTIGEGVDFEGHQKALSDLMVSDAENIRKSVLDGIENTTQRTAVATRIGNAIAPHNIRKAVAEFTNKFGKSTDYDSLDIINMVGAGIENFVKAVADGRAEGSKDLIGYMGYEHLKYDLSKTNIPEAFFAIPGEEGQLIGVNGWSRTNNVVGKIANNINSRLGKGSYTEADIYSVLSDEFFGKYKDGGNPFAKHWDGAADNIVGNKSEAVSPAMLWIQGITSGQDVSPDYKSPSLKEVVDMLAARKKS